MEPVREEKSEPVHDLENDCASRRRRKCKITAEILESSRFDCFANNSPKEPLVEEFIRAVKLENMKMVKSFFSSDELSLEEAEIFETFRFLLATYKFQLFLELIEDNKFVLHYKGSGQNTLLHYAVRLTNIKSVQLLMKYNIDIHSVNENNETALHIAVKTGHSVIFYELLKIVWQSDVFKQCNVVDSSGFSSLHIICMGSNSKYLADFLHLNKDSINGTVSENSEFYPGYNALHFAAHYGKYDNVKILLENGADAKAITTLGQSMLHLACETIHLEAMFVEEESEGVSYKCFNQYFTSLLQQRVRIVNILLENGCDVNTRDSLNGDSPLFYVVQDDCKIMDTSHVKFLTLKPFAQLSYRNRDIINQIVIDVKSSIIESILKSCENLKASRNNSTGLDVKECDSLLDQVVNFRSNLGYTCFHYIAGSEYDLNSNTYSKIIELLYKSGANINTPSNDFMWPVHFAARRNRPLFFIYLLHCKEIKLENWVNLDVQDRFGNTALHYEQAKKPAVHTLEFCASNFFTLLKFGADMFIENENNDSVFSMNCNNILKILSNDSLLTFLNDDIKMPEVSTAQHRIDLLCIGLFWQHLIKLKVCGYYNDSLHDFFLEKVSSTFSISKLITYEMSVVIASCEREVNEMKKIRICKVATLLDLLKKSINTVVTYTKNDNLKQILESPDFDKRFPKYSEIMKMRYVRALSRAPLLEAATRSFSHLVQLNIPELVLTHIFGFLNEKHLRDIIESNQLAPIEFV